MVKAKTFMFNPEQIARELLRTAARLAIKQTRYVGDMGVFENEPGRFTLWVESDVQLGDLFDYAFSKNKHYYLIKITEVPGRFDWAADTYIKDYSEVQFALKP